MKTVDSILIDRGYLKNKLPYQRYGQAVWNEMKIHFSFEMVELRGTEFDCFYDDKKVDIFLSKLKELVEKEVDENN